MFRSQVPVGKPNARVVHSGEPRPETTSPGPRTAVFVVHGMGQQVRFETLDGVAKALLRAAGEATPGRDAPTTVRLVGYEGRLFPRAEIALPKAGGGARDVHLYEAYWAPFTEGRIRTYEVLNFLIGAGLAGFRYAAFTPGGRRRFTRHMFGDWQKFRIPLASALALALSVSVLLGVVAADALTLAAWISRLSGRPFAAHVPTLLLGLGTALLAASVPLRAFLHEFVGDVVIYVSSYKVNRFYETRDAIQKAALDVARCVYGLVDGLGEPAYDRILVVGHSLGSVIAYDTLNAVLRESPEPFAPKGPVARTGALITFGSPLDKTAFVFRTQKRETSDVREALAAAVQPLIADYQFRPPRWLNLWSPNDPISGSLEFYDVDDEHAAQSEWAAWRSRRVENVVDPDARTPGLAHNEYWNNALLARSLWEEVMKS